MAMTFIRLYFQELPINDIDSVLELLHRVDVSDIADFSEVHGTSIFRVEVSRMVNVCM
jgi:hypothetical protein